MAYIMTRWMRSNRNNVQAALQVVRLKISTRASMVPTTADNRAEWPSRATILEAHRNSTNQNGDFQADEDGLFRINGRFGYRRRQAK